MPVTVDWSSDRAIRVVVGDGAPSDAALARVHALDARLRRAWPPGIADITPAYATIVLTVDLRDVPDEDAAQALRERVRAIVNGASGEDVGAAARADARTIEIPACYDAAYAPDLADVCTHTGLTAADVIARHSGTLYTVAFLGFSPGFAYLHGLHESLHTPRTATPRTSVQPGSVAIGGAHTGVYPLATAGGWRVIARTPLRLFEAARAEPSLLRAGDRVRFVPVDRAHVDALARTHSPAEGAAP